MPFSQDACLLTAINRGQAMAAITETKLSNITAEVIRMITIGI